MKPVCYKVLGGFSVLFVLTGVIMTPIGLVNYRSAAALEPAKDFVSLGKVCRVTAVKHCWKTQHKDDGKSSSTACIDEYWASFEVPSAGGGMLSTLARKEDVKRGGGRCGNGCGEVPGVPSVGSFPVGGPYQCWMPADNRSSASLPSAYKCGNPECYKLFSPRGERQRAIDGSKVVLIVGGANGGVGLLAALVLGCIYCREARRRKEREGHGEPILGWVDPGPPSTSGQPVVTSGQPVPVIAQPIPAVVAQPVQGAPVAAVAVAVAVPVA